MPANADSDPDIRQDAGKDAALRLGRRRIVATPRDVCAGDFQHPAGEHRPDRHIRKTPKEVDLSTAHAGLPAANAPASKGVLADLPASAFRGGKQWTLRVIVTNRTGLRREARFKAKRPTNYTISCSRRSTPMSGSNCSRTNSAGSICRNTISMVRFPTYPSGNSHSAGSGIPATSSAGRGRNG